MRRPATGVMCLILLLQLPVLEGRSAENDGRDGMWNIQLFGAIGDGQTLNTESFEKAMAAAREAGGGIILVPAGVYLTGTIQLTNNITLQLQPGAVLKGSPDVKDYKLPGQQEVFSSGARDTASVGLITARGAENVAIVGPGTIDGNGTSFMQLSRLHNPIDYNPARTRLGRTFPNPSRGVGDGPVLPRDRPERMILFSDCRNILIRDLTLLDSPCWSVHFADCDQVTVNNVRIDNNPLIPNSDGIHSTSSRNIHISNCHVRAGDDGIIVSGLGDKPGVAENVTVSNCTISSRSAGIRVGYGENDVRNCTFHNLVIYDSNRGLGVFARDKGSISHISFSDIIIHTRFHTGHWWGKGEPIHISATPYPGRSPTGSIRDVRFSNIQATSQAGIVVHGGPNNRIRDVWFDRIGLRILKGPLTADFGGNLDLRPTASLDDSIVAYPIGGLTARHTAGLRIKDFKLDWDTGLPDYFESGIECLDFVDLLIDGFQGGPAHTGSPAVDLTDGSGATVRACLAVKDTGVFLRLQEIPDGVFFENNDMRAASRAVETTTSSPER